MKTTTKMVLGAAAVMLFSSTVAGVTTYSMMKGEKENSGSFTEMFSPNPNVKLASMSATEAQPVDLTQAAELSLHAVVHIKSTQNGRDQIVRTPGDIFDYFFGDGYGRAQRVRTQPRVGIGSGVIISKDGYIVTNNHVIDKADEISVTLNDNREFKGRLIGTDPSTDLALIKIEADDLPTIPVGDSDALKVGEWVLAVGNPFNLTSTVTAGIVSAKARTLGVYNGGIESFIQTDAAINEGNSGGALVNARGELVGINSVLTSPTGSYTGYGFAIPTSIMVKVVSDLKQYGTVQRAVLGIMGHDIDDRVKDKDLGTVEGVYVADITEASAAANADIRKDDVITAIDGKKVKNMAELQEAMAKHRPGDKVKVTLLRAKKEMTVSVVLRNSQGNTKVVKNAGLDILGAAFRELPDEMKQQLRLSYGLEVTGVSKGKMADAGIRKGFIILRANGETLRTVDDLENVLREASQSPDQVLFLSGVFPSGRRGNYAVDLSQGE